MFLQIIVGAMFVIQSRLIVATLAVVLLPIPCVLLYSLGHAIDYAFELVGIGLALYLMAPALSPPDLELHHRIMRLNPIGFALRVETQSRAIDLAWTSSRNLDRAPLQAADFEHRERLAAAILRTLLGAQLIVLAVHDKLLEPGVSLAFVDKYSFVNIPALLGADGFSNLHFVFGAGIGELVLGILLVANIATRAVCVLMTGLFVTTGLAFGIEEMVGHLPIIATLVVVTVVGSEGRGVGSVIDRWQVAALNLAGAATVLLIGASIAVSVPASNVAPVNAGDSVPAILYQRFASATDAGRLAMRAEISKVDKLVRRAFDEASKGRPVNKDELARNLFDLSVRYEAAFGRDGASLWLRYAHLTASCSHDDLRFARELVGGAAWQEVLAKAPATLVNELLPVVHAAAAAIVNQSFEAKDVRQWRHLAILAPAGGPDYTHTHNLAAIARILKAAAQESELWVPETAMTRG